MASLALLTDAGKRWRPSAFSYCLLGCEVRIDFPIVKLQDYAGDIDHLLTLDNPFALVTVAHLLTQKTKGNAHRRRIEKWRLTKLLYQRNWERERIINLYRVIDWIMFLPKELDARLRQGILLFERRGAMTYMSSIERIGMELGVKKGMEQGRRDGLAEMLALMLAQRFGKLDAVVSDRLAAADAGQLTAWTKKVLGAATLAEVFDEK
ncbi:MAG TPA: transposase [Duganella sp.]